MTDAMGSAAHIHVVAGVLRDGLGRVLLARRPLGKQHAGYWEFPGGKVEQGETPQAALIRELAEELGIHAQPGRRLISVPMGAIVLDVFEIDQFSGEPAARDGQTLVWIDPARIDPLRMPPADRPVVTALRLPDRYLITPMPRTSEIPAFLQSIELALASGIRLIQLRLPGWARNETAVLSRRVRDRCLEQGARLLLNSDWQLAEVLGLDGVHLPSRIAATLTGRPLGPHRWLGVSCHSAEELEHAVSLGADFATLSPVEHSDSHADAIPFGWTRFAALVAQAPLPVYARGGKQLTDIETARASGAQGIAAIRSLWPNNSADDLVAGK